MLESSREMQCESDFLLGGWRGGVFRIFRFFLGFLFTSVNKICDLNQY